MGFQGEPSFAPGRRANVGFKTVLGTPADHFEQSGFGALRVSIRGDPVIILCVPVLDPLPGVAGHVMHTVGRGSIG